MTSIYYFYYNYALITFKELKYKIKYMYILYINSYVKIYLNNSNYKFIKSKYSLIKIQYICINILLIC